MSVAKDISSIHISLIYLRVLELPEVKEADLPKVSNNKKASHFCEALSEPCRIRLKLRDLCIYSSFGEAGKKVLLKVCLNTIHMKFKLNEFKTTDGLIRDEIFI